MVEAIGWFMRKKAPHKLLSLFLLVVIGWFGNAASADSGVYDNLDRSRQALLNQRAHLQESADQINQRIAQLQRQLDSINAYLRDTDNAIRDVDNALKRY